MRPPGAPAYDEQPASSPGSRPQPVPKRFDPSLLHWRNDDDILSPHAVAVSQTSDARQPFASRASSDFCPTMRTRKMGVAAPEAGADVWRQRRSGNVNAPPPPPPELPESVLAFILRRVACLPGGGIPSVLAAGAVCRGEEGRGRTGGYYQKSQKRFSYECWALSHVCGVQDFRREKDGVMRAWRAGRRGRGL